MQPYALATNVMDPLSIGVLEDWLNFLGPQPGSLHCFCGGNEAAKDAVSRLCTTRGIRLILTPDEVCEDVRHDEISILRWQFEHVSEPYCALIHLDTLPYREGDDDWLAESLAAMEENGFLFITGSSRVFRADRARETPSQMATQRISNNFVVLRPREWLALEREYRPIRDRFERYYTEAFIEHHCAEKDVWGLRLVNRPDWRVFHVQVWDTRIWAIREKFRAGQGIDAFLNGYEDDQLYLWDMYYMHPKPSWLRLMRIKLGRLRREIFAAG